MMRSSMRFSIAFSIAMLLLLFLIPRAEAAIALSSTLSRGSTGADVKALQQFLANQGYLSTECITGFFGACTKAGVQSYQAAKGIAPLGSEGSGIVGPKTRAAIQSSSSAASPTQAQTSNLTPGQTFAPAASRTTSRDCPSGWICPTTPILDPSTEIGFWYEPWYAKPGYTPRGYFKSDVSWETLSQYEPTYGYYWSGDPDNIDYEFDLLNEIGADYLILDNTNLAIIADKGNIEKNIQAIFKENSERPKDKQVALSVAIGGELWAAHDVDMMNNAADFVYDTYTKQSAYYELDGKPLLVDYNAYTNSNPTIPLVSDTNPTPTEPNWTDPRFSVRYATGIISQSDPGILYSQQTYPGITKYGWWGWMTMYPQYNTPESVLMVPGADHTHRLYTETSPVCGGCLFHIDREGGKTFMNAWLTAIKVQPRNITIASWNDFSEENGIEPATPARSEAPKWVDSYGTETPDWYMQIASGYMHLRQGLMVGAYYRDEDDLPVYQVVNGQFVYQAALPHGHPVILLPAGTIKNLLGVSESSDARVQGYKILGDNTFGPPEVNEAAVTAKMVGGAVAGNSSNQNPYYIALSSGETYTASVQQLSGYSIGYTLCIDRTDCHTETPVFRTSVSFEIPAGNGHYADLWWHYTADVTPPPLTATLTANGAADVSVKKGDSVSFAWSSTNAVSAEATVTSDTPDTCTARLEVSFPVASGSYRLNPVGACRVGHTYVVTYTVTDAIGREASDSVAIHVAP